MEDKHSPIVEYRGEKEAWIYLPEERTEIYIVQGEEVKRISLNVPIVNPKEVK